MLKSYFFLKYIVHGSTICSYKALLETYSMKIGLNKVQHYTLTCNQKQLYNVSAIESVFDIN